MLLIHMQLLYLLDLNNYYKLENKKILRLGLPERFIFENGTRDHLIDTNGLSVDSIVEKIETFVK